MKNPEWIDTEAENFGEKLLELLRQVRRYKAERGLSVGAELEVLYICGGLLPVQRAAFELAMVDCQSVTRAKRIDIEVGSGGGTEQILRDDDLLIEI